MSKSDTAKLPADAASDAAVAKLSTYQLPEVVVHPIVLLSVVDHYNRLGTQRNLG